MLKDIADRYRQQADRMRAEARRIRVDAIARRKAMGWADGAYFAELSRAYELDQLADDVDADLDRRWGGAS